MKISGTGFSPKMPGSDRGARGSGRASGSTSSEPAARVDLSPEAGFVSALKEEAAATSGEFRQELVDEVREQLREGTFEGSVDMDAVVDSLLADL